MVVKDVVSSIDLAPAVSPPPGSHSGAAVRDVVWLAPNRSLAVSERRLLLIAVDVLVLVAVGYVLALEHIGPGNSLGLAFLFAVPWLVFAQLSGLYDLATAARGRRLLTAFAAAESMYGVALLLFYFVFVARTWPGGQPAAIGRANFLIFMVAPLAIGLWRLAYLRLLGAAHFQRKVLVVGPARPGDPPTRDSQ